jgi:hypothetical protein
MNVDKYRHLQWMMAVNLMRQAVKTIPGMVFMQRSVVQLMTNAMIQDHRGCSINRDIVESCNGVICAELEQPYAMEPTCSVQEIVSAFKVRPRTNILI